MEEKNQPEKKFSTGAISATVWKNVRTDKEGKAYETRTVSLQRRYTDKTGQWQSTNSLRLNDLPKAALVIEEAYRYLVLNGHDETKTQEVIA
ncbi:Uncharacterised protein [uncultured archaeon]|nr:Uncharacterised protein [uncultured archaeon]